MPYLHGAALQGCPSRHFGENQLSPRSLGISPLPTAHPKALQRPQVRPSSPCYRTFSLAMGSSRGFGSHRHNSIALFRLAFAPAPRVSTLNLARPMHSPAHSSISTPSLTRGQAPTVCRHVVSGSLSLPSRGAFHLSLTVLVHYRSVMVFSLGGWSPLLPTGFPLARGTHGHGTEPERRRLRDSHPLWSSLPGTIQLTLWLLTPCGVLRPHLPAVQHPCDIGRSATQPHRFGLLPFRSPLLGECSLFLGVLRCFSSPSARSRSYVFTTQRLGITRARLPHSETRGSAR